MKKVYIYWTSIFLLSSLLIFFSTFQFFSCSDKRIIQFAKKFEEVKSEFQKKYDQADTNFDIDFKDLTSRCAIPYSTGEFEYFLDPISNPQKISVAIFINRELKIPFIMSLILKDILNSECNEAECKLGENKTIKHKAEIEERKIQEEFILRKIKFQSEYADIEAKSYYSTKTSEAVSEIKIALEDGYTENITYSSKITQSEGEKTIEIILESENSACYTRVSFIGDNTRRFQIFVLEGNKYQKFSGELERNPLCPQKPKGNINKSIEAEEIGDKCDSIFESSNIEFLLKKIQEKAEKDDYWFNHLKNIGENYGLFGNEIKIIEFSRIIKNITDEVNFGLIYEGKEKIRELISKSDESLEKLKNINVAFPNNLEIYLMPGFVLPASYQVNQTEKLFFESAIYFIRFLLVYLESLNLNLEQNTRNSILNTIRASQNLRMKDKVELFVKSVKKSSGEFLTTENKDKRREAYELFKSSLTKIIEFSKSLTLDGKTGFFRFVPNMPKIPESITYVVDNSTDHKTLSSYLEIISSFLKTLYEYSGNEHGFLTYLFDKVSGNWFYNLFEINIKKLIEGNLRQMLPAMYSEKDNFIIEWECNGPIYSYQMFPESITCTDEILTDSKHFYGPQFISNGIETMPNPFYNKGIRENGITTRFPHIFFLDPTFDNSIIIKRWEIFEACNDFSSEKEKQICHIVELMAFLTK